jgi:hypothetical protein
MDTDSSGASVSVYSIALGPYAKEVGWILLRLLLQVLVAALATALIIALRELPQVTALLDVTMKVAEKIGTGFAAGASVLEYFQLAVESLFLVFVLLEFATALVRISRVGRW